VELNEVVERARDGDSVALQRLVSAHRDMALGYARKFVDFDRAEDAVQESMLIVQLKLGNLIDSNRFEAWLRGIVRNRCLHARNQEPSQISERELAQQADGFDLLGNALNKADYDRLVEAVIQLSPLERKVIVLHYQLGLSQAAIGDRLGMSKGTVNMRLHSARQRLRRRLTMNEKELASSHVGHVVESDGALVTLKFSPEGVPLIFSRLRAGDAELCVAGVLSDGTVQAIATRTDAIWTPGSRVIDEGRPFMGGLPGDLVAKLFPSASRSVPPVRVGIKSIDIFAPLVKDGLTGIFAEWGLGLLVLAPELLGRLESLTDRHTVVSFVPPLRDEVQWREINGEIALGSKRLEMFYVPVADPMRTTFIEQVGFTTSNLVLSRRLSEQDIWPCVDPLRSSSKSRDLPADETANRVRDLLRRYYAFQFPTASEEDRALTAQEWTDVRRARLASQFLSQPFFVAEPYTNRPGLYADRDQSLATFDKILDGSFDDRPKTAFSMAGAIPT